jgi:hypothetical protein
MSEVSMPGSFLNSTGCFKVINFVAIRFFGVENRRGKPRGRICLHFRNEVSVDGEGDVYIRVAEHGAHFGDRRPIHQVNRRSPKESNPVRNGGIVVNLPSSVSPNARKHCIGDFDAVDARCGCNDSNQVQRDV